MNNLLHPTEAVTGGAVRAALVGVPCGILLGFLLEKSSIYKHKTVKHQLQFKDDAAAEIYLASVGTGLAGVTLLKYLLPGSNLTKYYFASHPKPTNLRADIVGGSMIALGANLSHTVPGSMLVQIGAGHPNAMYTALGGLLGTAAFEYFKPSIRDYFYGRHHYGVLTLPSVLNLPHWIVSIGVAGSMLGAAFVLQHLSRKVREHKKRMIKIKDGLMASSSSSSKAIPTQVKHSAARTAEIEGKMSLDQLEKQHAPRAEQNKNMMMMMMPQKDIWKRSKWNPVLAGIGLGLCHLPLTYLMNSAFVVRGATAIGDRMGDMLRMLGMSPAAPHGGRVAETEQAISIGAKSALQFVVNVGIVIGAFISSKLSDNFNLERKRKRNLNNTVRLLSSAPGTSVSPDEEQRLLKKVSKFEREVLNVSARDKIKCIIGGFLINFGSSMCDMWLGTNDMSGIAQLSVGCLISLASFGITGTACSILSGKMRTDAIADALAL